MQTEAQKSETLLVGLLLAFSGGFMDAYTYIFRGEVFANAQTGNIVLFGIHIFNGSWADALRYLLPVLCFTGGVFIAQLLRRFFQRPLLNHRVHWRQLALLLEIIMLLLVSTMPSALDAWANSLVSFACGLQVQSFRKIQNTGLATTMCIGNLRSGTDIFCNYFYDHNGSSLHKGKLYYLVIITFMCGAIAGGSSVSHLGQYAILISAVLLSMAFFFMATEHPST